MGSGSRLRLATIPNGAEMLDSLPGAEEKQHARRALQIADNAFVIVHVGRIGGGGGDSLASEPKAQDVLIRAFAQAFAEDPSAILAIAGDGPLRAEAENLATELGVSGKVLFLGEQPEPWRALRAADLFFFPSRYEGLPLVLIEAASCGLPVVASDIPEIRALYPGNAWRLTPVEDVTRFADALLNVRAELELYTREAREAAGKFRETFSMRACANKYLHAYQSILGQNAVQPNPEERV